MNIFSTFLTTLCTLLTLLFFAGDLRSSIVVLSFPPVALITQWCLISSFGSAHLFVMLSCTQWRWFWLYVYSMLTESPMCDDDGGGNGDGNGDGDGDSNGNGTGNTTEGAMVWCRCLCHSMLMASCGVDGSSGGNGVQWLTELNLCEAPKSIVCFFSGWFGIFSSCFFLYA